ncbi:MAG TPA: adenylate/guanylate cyclase domain-containing protein, partial [Candidatus Deferrimicrobium sp.]|nr:adenylate/guanylate cyclase domain-containing protein [Candidatus Deferrimicrobium sp.]
MIPETSYARIGDLHLAYQVLGDGPPDILSIDYWIGHVEAQWDVPPLAAYRERLATFGRVIMFDKRGTGLSDPVPTAELPLLETWMDDASAVLDAAGSTRAVVIANIGGGMIATTFAAAHPERVSHLVLVDCFARTAIAPDYPIGVSPDVIEEQIAGVEAQHGHGQMLDLFGPSVAGDDVLRRALGRFERLASSPGSQKAIIRLINAGDVRGVLPAIRVPTLVIERTGPSWLPAGQGRYLAEHIPGAKYVALPGADRMIWTGDSEAIIAEIQDFVTGVRPAPTPSRVLATVLFTDIVGSTQRAAEMGDARWRAVLAEHHRVTRRQLERFGGTEIKTVGDGILATFDGPARAVRCAAAIRDEVRELGL